MPMTAAQIEYKRKQRAERQVNGICTRCGLHPLATKAMCASCREYVRVHKKVRERRLKARERMRRLRESRKKGGKKIADGSPS